VVELLARRRAAIQSGRVNPIPRSGEVMVEHLPPRQVQGGGGFAEAILSEKCNGFTVQTLRDVGLG
jgi:hypothetical protein